MLLGFSDFRVPGDQLVLYEKWFSAMRFTPGRFRTRVISEGVTPRLHVDYKHTRTVLSVRSAP